MARKNTIVYPENAESIAGFGRFEGIVTPKMVNERYLHGVDTRDNQGNKLSDDVLKFAIKSAIQELEQDLEITITPSEYTEWHDYKMEDYWEWGYLRLKHKPILSVDHFYIQVSPTAPMTEFPQEWIRIQNAAGQIQVAPISGAMGNFNMGNVSLLPRLLVFNSTFPNFFKIVYKAGFESLKVPVLVNQYIGIRAARDVLNVAGDLVLGAGVASTSLGIDGLSQSISSTASAENTAYGARLILYEKDLKRIRGILKKYYGKNIKHVVC